MEDISERIVKVCGRLVLNCMNFFYKDDSPQLQLGVHRAGKWDLRVCLVVSMSVPHSNIGSAGRIYFFCVGMHVLRFVCIVGSRIPI